MEALAEIALAVFAFVLEVTIHAAVFVFFLLMSIFSPKYRAKLKRQWDTSNRQKFSLVLGVALYSAALIFALVVWLPLFRGDGEKQAGSERRGAITIEFSQEEVKAIGKTKGLDELVDVAGSALKRKLAERKEKAEKRAAEQTPPAELPR